MPIKRKKYILLKIIILQLFAVIFFISFSRAQGASLNIPKIISRAEWGADESKMNWLPEYAKIEKFVIHHTASSNLVPDSDGSGEYKNMVNDIYNYHDSKKTWSDDNKKYTGFGDIGYNYLIDPNGNIYEGRFGGNGVIGGHVRGYNVGSVGISVLGRYQNYTNEKGENILSDPVTFAIKKSLDNLIGWIAANNGIDLNKVTNFHGKNIDGLVGHRDLTPTICPGDKLENELDTIQKNANIIEKGYKKSAYQIGGDRSIYIIEDGYKTRYSSKEKLPSIYQDRIIRPILKSQLDAYKYKNIVVYPNGSLLQEFDVAKVYYIENGQKRAMEMTGEEFGKMGFSQNDIIKVFKSDLKIYKDGKNIRYATNNKLIKDKNGNVFLTEKGKKRKFTSAQLFEYLGYKWNNIKKDPYLDFYLRGSDMIYPNKTLVREKNNDNIYFIENKQRRKITSENLLKVLGYSLSNVISVTKNELSHFPEGEIEKYPNGTLIKVKNFPIIYLIDNKGKRKEFTSAQLFKKLGYKWKDVITITKEEFKNYLSDGKMLYPNGLLIKSTNSPIVYLLKSGKRRMITSTILFKKLGYKWKDIISISPSEMKEYQIGKILTYPDGTLIRLKGFPTVYKIEDGKKKEFTSLTLFKKTKNKWSDVIVLNSEEFLAYHDGGIVKYPENTLLKIKNIDKIYVIKNGNAKWIKTLEDFQKAGYKWSNIIEISKSEMALYTKSKIIIDKHISQVPKQKNNNIKNIKNNNIKNIKNNIEENNPNIKIAIYSSSGKDVKITANGNYTVNYYNSNGIINKTEKRLANEQTTIKYFNSSNYIKFIPSTRNVILKILSYKDLAWDKKTNDNEFRGNIEIIYSKTSQKLWIINELPLEDYLNGVAEALNNSPEEYLKSFSVIARTYAMFYIKRGGKHPGEPFYLKNSENGNGNDQVYKGYNFEMRAPRIIEANKSTTGYIIDYNDKPIVAAYSSDSGGTTKNACIVLNKTYCGDDYAYLFGGIKDPTNTKHNQTKISESHGVGMSAVGAYQMAINKNTWQEIIEHYYPGVEIKKYY